MASTHSAHGHGGHTVHADPNNPFHIHHQTVPTYWAVYIALLALLGVTVGLYFIDLQKIFTFIPGVNLIVALIVAVVKATLVILFFMNVQKGTRLVWLWAAMGFIWLLLMGGVFMDYQSRAWVDQSGWQAVPNAR